MKTKIGILTFLLTVVLFGNAIFSPLKAVDTAALLPPGVLQLFDNNGNPLSSGYIYTYEVGTSTLKTTWKDSAEVTPNTNPIRLDAGGKAIVYGSGTYRTVVKDRNGNLIWDAVTAPGGGGGSTPTAVGDGLLVGSVLPWSGLIAPNQYVFAAGQEISRATFPEFYTAITQQLNVICSISSNILTGISDTSQINVGSPIELPLCVISGTTVVSKTISTVTLSNPSSVSINSVATFFPYGNGNGSTTFNVPDLRGNVIAGRDNMGGTAAGRLTTAYYGLTNPDALGAIGGSQNHTQTISEIAAHSHTVNDPGHTHTVFATVTGTNGSSGPGLSSTSGASDRTTSSSTTGITISNAGSSSPFTIVQPTITLNYIIKVTPDTSTSISTGVFSIGGMTGVISCGSGLLCTGNIISVNQSVVPSSGPSGGILFFSNTVTISASNALTSNQIVIGGGAGVAPTTFACATTTTVVHGGTPPTCSQIVNNDITTNTISDNKLIQSSAATLRGNPTNSTANGQSFTLSGLTQTISPNSSDWLLIFDNSTGTFHKINAGSIATSATAGVASLNGLSGALTIGNGRGIAPINLSGTTLGISADIATAANFEAGTTDKLLSSDIVFTPETTTSFGTTTAFDANTFINTKVTLTGNITTMNCSNFKAGQSGQITFIQDSTGSRTAAFSSGTCGTLFRYTSASTPTLTTSASAIDTLSFSCRSSSYCFANLNKGFNP